MKILAAFIWIFSAANTHALEVPATDVYDFLIQDVCVENGVVTAKDPANCLGTTRNLMVDETLPYHKVTGHVPKLMYGMLEISNSFPIRGYLYDPRVVHTFDEGGTLVSTFQDFDNGHDGYEVTEVQGANVSFVGTHDGNGIKPFFNSACGHDDSWYLFPTNLPALTTPASGGFLDAGLDYITLPHGTSRTLTNFGCVAPHAVVHAGTYYLRGLWTYNNGRVLDTMVTSHYEQLTSQASNSMERFYYTRWYGRTRWESWKKGNYTPDKSCSGPYTEAGGWVREHCREFTRIVPDTRGGFEPRSWPVYQFMGRGNLLLNHDFAVGDFSNWSFTGASSKVIVRNAEGYTSINNNNAHGQFWGAEGATIYQDLGRHAELANGQYMSYGIRAWSTGGPATIHVGVWEFNSVSGNKFNSTSFTIQANMPKLYRGWFNLQANTTSFRYQVYLNPGGNRINLDDAWFTPM